MVHSAAYALILIIKTNSAKLLLIAILAIRKATSQRVLELLD
jgi:hypothetical protein